MDEEDEKYVSKILTLQLTPQEWDVLEKEANRYDYDLDTWIEELLSRSLSEMN